jgi:hypothetical protein
MAAEFPYRPSLASPLAGASARVNGAGQASRTPSTVADQSSGRARIS